MNSSVASHCYAAQPGLPRIYMKFNVKFRDRGKVADMKFDVKFCDLGKSREIDFSMKFDVNI